MKRTFEGRLIAILATDGVEQDELTAPRTVLDAAGAETRLLAPKPGLIRAWDFDRLGGNYVVDLELKNALVSDFDALILPGGLLDSDRLRRQMSAVQFVHNFLLTGRPVAAISYGQQILIETRKLQGRKLTSSPSLRTDFINAGAFWLDEPVVQDQNLITSRSLDDLPALTAQMLEMFSRSARYTEPAQSQIRNTPYATAFTH